MLNTQDTTVWTETAMGITSTAMTEIPRSSRRCCSGVPRQPREMAVYNCRRHPRARARRRARAGMSGREGDGGVGGDAGDVQGEGRLEPPVLHDVKEPVGPA